MPPTLKKKKNKYFDSDLQFIEFEFESFIKVLLILQCKC